ncbi:MAG: thymidine kinase [Bacteroidota bacterium]
MFTESNLGTDASGHQRNGGWVELICGSMFSGKTEELIRRINRAIIAGQDVEIFKPAVDTRYHDSEVVSHNSRSVRSTPVDFAEDILLLAGGSNVVGIDEAQFFDDRLPEVVTQLANQGKRVILAGLDMDFEGKPFGPMPEIMATAEYVTKIHAICMSCGGIASHSFRKTATKNQVQLGEKDTYEARCRRCWLEGRREQEEQE